MKNLICIYLFLNFLVLSSCSTVSVKNTKNTDLSGLNKVSSDLSVAYSEYKNKYERLFLELRNLPIPEQNDGLTSQLGMRIDEKLKESQQLIYDQLLALEFAQAKSKMSSSAQQNETEVEKLNLKFIELIKSENLKLNNYKKDLLAIEKLVVNSVTVAGSYFCFTDLNFKTDTAEIVLNKQQSQKAFERLAHYAKSCPKIKFEVHGHTSRDIDNTALSLNRARAVQKKLTQVGVKPEQIVEAKGFASTNSLIVEPEIGSLEEKNMQPRELEYIRSINNRIEIKVVQACQP